MTDHVPPTLLAGSKAGPPRPSPWRLAAWSTAVLVMLTPWIAMQLTDAVAWSAGDFVLLGALLLGVGIPLDLAARRTEVPAYRRGVALAVGAAVLLVGANGAVGIVGAEGNAVNPLFGGVLAIGIAGALLARFRPRGMAVAMAATALAQASVALGALLAGWVSPTQDRVEIVALWGFAALWAGSAWLFRRAARVPQPADAR